MATTTDRQTIVKFDNVSFSYDSDTFIIRELSLEIGQGELVCLLGRNGSGKSTLLKLIAGLLLPSAGAVMVAGVSTQDHRRLTEMRRQIGFIFQNPEDQIIATTVEADIAFTLENLGVNRETMHRQVDECAARFNLTELLKRHPLALSAGEKQRTALASVMVVAPEVLLLDEPTSFLDYQGRRRLLEMVFADRSRTVIGATQYPNEVEKYDRVIFLDRGKIVFDGPRQKFTPTNLWTEMNDDGRDAVSSPVPTGEETAPLRGATLQLRGVSYGYTRKEQVIERASLNLMAGQITAIIGDSGCGKTTLALLLAGLVEPNGGIIRLNGSEMSSKKLLPQVAVLFQFPEIGFFAETVQEEVAFGIKDLRLNHIETEQRVRSALALVGLDFQEFAGRNPFTLSAGERRRVAIASALIMNRPIIIFDETTLGLDWEGRRAIVRLLHDLKLAGKTVAVMTHDIEFVAQTAETIILMDQGAVIWQGAIDATDLPPEFVVEHFGVKSLAASSSQSRK